MGESSKTQDPWNSKLINNYYAYLTEDKGVNCLEQKRVKNETN